MQAIYNTALDVSCVAVWTLYSIYFFWIGAKNNVMSDIIYEALISMTLADLSDVNILVGII